MDFPEFEIDLDELARQNMPKPKPIAITQDELEGINKKAYLDATYKFLTTAYLREHVRAFSEDGTMPFDIKDKKLLTMLENQANQLITKPPFVLITINPRPEVTLPELQKVVAKLLKKTTITHFAYTYEVRTGESGLHVHILVQYNDKPHHFKRGIKNTTKNICDSNNPNILNFKFISEQNLDDKINYLKGEKKTSKLKGVEDSVAYREKYNLLPLYESSPPLPCRATEEIPMIEEAE